jgi:hypothetical protein
MIEKNLEELDNAEVQQLLLRGPVLLIGSAISQFSPTDLPAGGQLVATLLDKLLPSPPWLRKDAEALPFEGILECYPRQNELRDLILDLYGRPTLANPLHKYVADALQLGTVSSVITTNYDLTIESQFVNDSVVTIRREEDFVEWKRNKVPKKVYFKIHGSAERTCSNTLVFTLKHEGVLTDWKWELMQELLRGRDLVVLGYSGRDFELCPAIAKLPIRRVYWLQRPDDEGRVRLSANAENVLKRNGILLKGQIDKAIPVLLAYPEIPLKRIATTPGDEVARFDSGTFEEWRLRLLDRLACASIGIPLARKLSASDPLLGVFCPRMSGHSGEYLKAAKQWTKLSEEKGLSARTLVEYEIETAGAWFIYGDRRKSEKVLSLAEENLNAIQADKSLKEDLRVLQGNILRVKLTWLRREAQLAWRSSTLESIRQKAIPLYKRAVDCLSGGALDDLSMVQDCAELINIPLDERLFGISEAAYKSLGLKAMELISRRHRIETTDLPLQFADRKAVLRALNEVERYGWHHEGWKWYLIYIWYFKRFNFTTIRAFVVHFRSTEYPLSNRLARLALWPLSRILRKAVKGNITAKV